MKLIEIASFLTVFGVILMTFSVADAQKSSSEKVVTIAKVKAPAAVRAMKNAPKEKLICGAKRPTKTAIKSFRV